MLREAGEMEDVVVACGGGTPCFGSNMDYMLSGGLTVWLDTQPGRLVERLKTGGSRRPLVSGLREEELADYVTRTARERQPFYSRAAIKVDGTRLENRSQIEETVTAFLASLPTQH